jgi:hypothetical protein
MRNCINELNSSVQLNAVPPKLHVPKDTAVLPLHLQWKRYINILPSYIEVIKNGLANEVTDKVIGQGLITSNGRIVFFTTISRQPTTVVARILRSCV